MFSVCTICEITKGVFNSCWFSLGAVNAGWSAVICSFDSVCLLTVSWLTGDELAWDLFWGTFSSGSSFGSEEEKKYVHKTRLRSYRLSHSKQILAITRSRKHGSASWWWYEVHISYSTIGQRVRRSSESTLLLFRFWTQTTGAVREFSSLSTLFRKVFSDGTSFSSSHQNQHFIS